MDIKNSNRFQKLRQTLSWENVIVMIILFPTMFILVHWSFKSTPLPDYVKELLITLIKFVIAPIIATKSVGSHIFNNVDNKKNEK